MKLLVVDTEAHAKVVVRSILVKPDDLEEHEAAQLLSIMPRSLGPLTARSLVGVESVNTLVLSSMISGIDKMHLVVQ